MTYSRFKANARFAVALWSTSIQSAMALRAAFWMQIVFMALNNFAFMVFWWALFKRVPSIRGWQLADVAVLQGVTAAGFGLAMLLAGNAIILGRFIYEGELDALLTQPKSTFFYAVSSRTNASGLGDFASGVALIALSHKVPLAHSPAVALAVLASALVFVACWALHQSLTFWLGRIDALARVLWEATVTFGLYPEPLFGGLLRLILYSAIPAGFVGYLPARFACAPTLLGGAAMLAGALGYLALASWVFERGLRRYASGSRFGVFG